MWKSQHLFRNRHRKHRIKLKQIQLYTNNSRLLQGNLKALESEQGWKLVSEAASNSLPW
jgi:hypothetical protein